MDTTSVKNKLKRRVYNEVPVSIKLDAINKIESGIPIYDIAEELNVHHTTVRMWYKNKDNFIHHTSEMTKTKKRFRKSRQDNINRAVWIWFKQTRTSVIPITGPMIQSKALEFSLLFNNPDTFTASNGWLRSWKKNFQISLKSICSEKLSGETVDPFKQKFLDYIEKEALTPHQVFNGAKSRIFYKLLPEIIFCKEENLSPADVKKCEEVMTVMACSNASGTCKLPLVIIGESANSLMLEKEKSLPVSYKSHKKAWMIGDLFKSWFEYEFVPIVKEHLKNAELPCKALLVIDNYLSHNITLSKDGITVLFFPPNETSLIQPMEECLRVLKLLYKQRLMEYTVDSIDKLSLIEIIENITVKEATNWAAAAWNDVSAETIQKSWNQVWPWAGRIESCQIYSSQQRHISHLFNDFCSRLQNLDTSNSLNVSKLEQWLNSKHDTEEEKLSDTDIVEIIQDESQMNIDETEKDLDQMNEGSDDDKESNDNNRNHCYEFVEVKCDEDEEDLNKVDALLCVEYLREYCEKNNCMKSMTALDIIEGEIKS